MFRPTESAFAFSASVTALGKCPWCNGYHRKKSTRLRVFKSWTRLIAFHIVLIPLGKVWIQLFSLQLWVNSRADWVLQPWSREGKLWIQTCKTPIRNWPRVISCPSRGIGKYGYRSSEIHWEFNCWASWNELQILESS